MTRDTKRANLQFPKEVVMRTLIGSLMMVVVTACLLAGCMPESRAGNVYSRDQARSSQSVNYGTILRVDLVTIEGTQTGAGTVAGGAMGGALGSAVGSGSGQTIATVGGAILGGIAGSAIEKGVTTAQGVELEVQLDNGELLVVVQENDAVYKVGDRIRVLRDSQGTTRVRQ
jgi:outer membrane lipoprotein SlyB